ncbi:glycosyl hydrolase [Auriculariales sp. MPI-PUGE-AT-0066]|nr:glycosyl hydrolase [Auriculariales sp. MPI-PUGE-AT-0066]
MDHWCRILPYLLRATMKVFSILLGLAGLVHSFTNPILWEDLADLDIRRVNDTFYYCSSTMHYSPGAPILRSYDLANWEYIGHAVPNLSTFGSKYNLANGERAYVKGIWASFFVYSPNQAKWFWGGCIEFSKTYIYSSTSPSGPFTLVTTFNKCYYDSGALVDSDGTVYISYTNSNNVWVAQLSADFKTEVKSQQVYVPGSEGYLEGSRMYKHNSDYVILVTHPASQEYTLKSSSGPFGSYSLKILANAVSPPVTSAGNPHQGGLVDTASGNWYYVAFIDNYPGGRVPVAAPINWGSDGFPALGSSSWASSYPDFTTQRPLTSPTGLEFFSAGIPNRYEWNHVPDTTKYSTGSAGLTLNTATITYDLYSARNTLSRRILGPTSTATIQLNYGNMKDGDRAGLALLRDLSAWIGVKRDSGSYTVGFTNGLAMDSNWATTNTGTTVASQGISGGTIWLRITANIAPSSNKVATFYYSTTGQNSGFTSLGTYTMGTAWQFFMGYRFAIFNYATSATGGYVTVPYFDLGAGTSGSGTTFNGGTGTTTTGNTTTTTTTTSTGTGTCAAMWGQCGGTGWTGPTCCVSGSTCTYSNQYYSQCL